MAKRKLEGKTVAITGGGGALGAALGREFAFSGGNVALLDINYGNAVVAADRITRGIALPVECDVTDPASCAVAISLVRDELGPVDVLVNSASVSHPGSFAATEVDVMRGIMEVNFWGSVHCTKEVLPSVTDRRGAIVVISSMAGFAPLLDRSGYVAAEHALQGLFGTLRAELRGTGVDVLIAAQNIDTVRHDHAPRGDGSETKHAQPPIGSISPEDTAERIVWAVERRRQTLVLGNVGKASRYLSAIAPGLYERLMTRSSEAELDR